MLSQLLAHVDLTGFSLFSAILFALVASISAVSLAGKVDTMERKITMLQGQLNERTIDIDRLDSYFPRAEESSTVVETTGSNDTRSASPAASSVASSSRREGIFKRQPRSQ